MGRAQSKFTAEKPKPPPAAVTSAWPITVRRRFLTRWRRPLLRRQDAANRRETKVREGALDNASVNFNFFTFACISSQYLKMLGFYIHIHTSIVNTSLNAMLVLHIKMSFGTLGGSALGYPSRQNCQIFTTFNWTKL